MYFDVINRYVLAGVGLFAVILYALVMCLAFADFVAGLPERGHPQKRSKMRSPSRKLKRNKIRKLS